MFLTSNQRHKEVEDACGMFLVWHNPPDKNMCRIYTRQDSDFLDEGLWPQQHEWLKEKLETLAQVFQPIIRNLDTGVVRPKLSVRS